MLRTEKKNIITICLLQNSNAHLTSLSITNIYNLLAPVGHQLDI